MIEIMTSFESKSGGVESGCRICDGPLSEKEPFGKSPIVVHCCECRTESLRPLPTPKELEDHYAGYHVTKTSEEDIRYLTELSVESLKFYLGKMNLRQSDKRPLTFLEIGFGNGAGLFAGAKLGFQSFGVDIDPTSAPAAESLAAKMDIKATCLCGDITAARKLGVEFDIVKASQILEHVIDPVEFLFGIAETQPGGGYLIIETPNNEAALWLVKNRMRKAYNRLNYYNSLKIKEHLWGYTRKGLPLMLEKAGYDITFFCDYASGNAIFEPQSVLWYPTLRQSARHLIKYKSWGAFLYSGVRIFDSLSSKLFHRGTGFAMLCQKVN
jgi:2-polyprenyl-3-methyl-5-hydroxy-6-metoxy-1,4-benzoquinol methylase